MAKKKCVTKNGKGKCLLYEKVHKNSKAMEAHKKALKKRGATVTEELAPGGIKLKYYFK
jgi:hypothetical protein